MHTRSFIPFSVARVVVVASMVPLPWHIALKNSCTSV